MSIDYDKLRTYVDTVEDVDSTSIAERAAVYTMLEQLGPDLAREILHLVDAGLLAPELPEPDIHGEWELADGITVTADEDEIAITAPIKGGHTIICWYGNPGQAQELAYALQAAAKDHKENPNWMNPSS